MASKELDPYNQFGVAKTAEELVGRTKDLQTYSSYLDAFVKRDRPTNNHAKRLLVFGEWLRDIDSGTYGKNGRSQAERSYLIGLGVGLLISDSVFTEKSRTLLGEVFNGLKAAAGTFVNPGQPDNPTAKKVSYIQRMAYVGLGFFPEIRGGVDTIATQLRPSALDRTDYISNFMTGCGIALWVAQSAALRDIEMTAEALATGQINPDAEVRKLTETTPPSDPL